MGIRPERIILWVKLGTPLAELGTHYNILVPIGQIHLRKTCKKTSKIFTPQYL